MFLAHAFNGRLEIWRAYSAFWMAQGKWAIVFGLGPGSTSVYLPSLVSYGGQQYSYAHNDWLQIAIEYGLVGLLLALLCAHKLFRLASEKDRATLIAFYIAMCSNMVLHWALPALVIWSILKETALYDKSGHSIVRGKG